MNTLKRTIGSTSYFTNKRINTTATRDPDSDIDSDYDSEYGTSQRFLDPTDPHLTDQAVENTIPASLLSSSIGIAGGLTKTLGSLALAGSKSTYKYLGKKGGRLTGYIEDRYDNLERQRQINAVRSVGRENSGLCSVSRKLRKELDPQAVCNDDGAGSNIYNDSNFEDVKPQVEVYDYDPQIDEYVPRPKDIYGECTNLQSGYSSPKCRNMCYPADNPKEAYSYCKSRCHEHLCGICESSLEVGEDGIKVGKGDQEKIRYDYVLIPEMIVQGDQTTAQNQVEKDTTGEEDDKGDADVRRNEDDRDG